MQSLDLSRELRGTPATRQQRPAAWHLVGDRERDTKHLLAGARGESDGRLGVHDVDAQVDRLERSTASAQTYEHPAVRTHRTVSACTQ